MTPGFEYWAMLEPMKYYNKEREGLSDNLKKKYDAMTENKDNEYIATCKWDGEWTMFIKWDNQILIRSRSISKVTGKYGDKTAHLPHLADEMREFWPDNTVILGEVCWGEFGTVSTDVGTILRCLPEKAVERQKERKLIVKVFDCLAIAGISYMNCGYEERYAMAHNFFLPMPESSYFSMTAICHDQTPAEFADEIIRQGGEGAVIQRKDCIYEPGKRSAWKTLKLKQRLPEMELQVICSLEPNKWYDGKEGSFWPYREWENVETGETRVFINRCPDVNDGNGAEWVEKGLVTKPYAMGWKIGVRVEYDGNEVDVTSGLTDEDREWLATKEAQDLIRYGQLFAIVQGMMKNTLGAIRHPIWKGCRVMDDSMRIEWE